MIQLTKQLAYGLDDWGTSKKKNKNNNNNGSVVI
jgi:hypothetical protein